MTFDTWMQEHPDLIWSRVPSEIARAAWEDGYRAGKAEPQTDWLLERIRFLEQLIEARNPRKDI